jgi:hypothetical protein
MIRSNKAAGRKLAPTASAALPLRSLRCRGFDLVGVSRIRLATSWLPHRTEPMIARGVIPPLACLVPFVVALGATPPRMFHVSTEPLTQAQQAHDWAQAVAFVSSFARCG